MKVSSYIIILIAFKFAPLIPVGQYRVENKCYLEKSRAARPFNSFSCMTLKFSKFLMGGRG